jgi:hypothetical protein
MALTPKAAFDPGLSSEWNELIQRLQAAENAHSTLDACRVTTAGAFLTTSTDPSELVKLRSAAITLLNGRIYRFTGQFLYTAITDAWALEIHKNSTAGTIVGGARLEASGTGGVATWNVTWPCTADETTSFYYVANRLSGAGTLTAFAIQDGFHNAFANIDLVGAASTLRDVA